MKAIIFGVGGQDGYYLSELLQGQGLEVIGVRRPLREGDTDIRNMDDVAGLIQKHQPDYIFHFAANSTTRHEVWQENHDVICTGSLNILEAVKTHSPLTRVFLSGSGLQFKNESRPISEKAEFKATSMYAASRIYTTYAARYYRTLGVRAYVGYFFTHDSPLRSERHVNKKIIETARRIAAGSGERLSIGDWNVQKEFGYAGDIVKAVWSLVNQEKFWEATIGTGEARKISDWLEICFSMFGLDWKDHTDQLPGFKAEYPVLVSDPTLIRSTGWQHSTSIQELAQMMAQ